MTVKLSVTYLVQFCVFHSSFYGVVDLTFVGSVENKDTMMVLKFLVFVSILVLNGEGGDYYEE